MRPVREGDGAGGARELLHRDDVLEVAEAEPAVLGRDGDSFFGVFCVRRNERKEVGVF